MTAPANTHERATQQLPDDELVPLSVASALVHSQLVRARRMSDKDSEEGIRLGAIALATLAPIYMHTGVGSGIVALAESEIEELLLRPVRAHAGLHLEALSIRRSDLGSAMEALKDA
jgi:hypothetical protein